MLPLKIRGVPLFMLTCEPGSPPRENLLLLRLSACVFAVAAVRLKKDVGCENSRSFQCCVALVVCDLADRVLPVEYVF